MNESLYCLLIDTSGRKSMPLYFNREFQGETKEVGNWKGYEIYFRGERVFAEFFQGGPKYMIEGDQFHINIRVVVEQLQIPMNV